MRVAERRRRGHWEIDTVMGRGAPTCVLSAVERVTGFVQLGQLSRATAAAYASRAIALFRRQPHPVRTVTADNGSEMAGYRLVEHGVGTRFYFADP